MKNAINTYSYQHGLGLVRNSYSTDVMPNTSTIETPVLELTNHLTPVSIAPYVPGPPKIFNNLVDGATMTLKTQIVDSYGAVPATVKIDNEIYAATDNGIFQKPNVKINAVVTIYFQGYKAVIAKASQIPAKIILVSDNAIALNPVVVKPKSKTNWLALLGIAAAVTVAYKYANKEAPKRVKAKI